MAGTTPPLSLVLPQALPQSAQSASEKTPTENINEALYLFLTAAVGFFMNILVVACILSFKRLRKMTSAFIVHMCVLDMIKCVYCIPFATSLLQDVAPSFCNILGGSYVIIVTASGFNIVAMICCEAYSFSEHNVGADGKGSLCCVVFGIVMVYIGSVIIHLGPTIIGGDFNYNSLIGNCIFVYGTIKSYVVHSMWIAIMTLAITGAVYYLVFFYRHVQANSTHRLASLVRASIAISRGNTEADNEMVRKIVRDALSRTRVLIALTALFIFCWYPLFILTLVDPQFQQSIKVYKLLTFIAWSNAALNPVVLMLFDRNLNVFRRKSCCKWCRKCHSSDEEPVTPLMPSTSRAPVAPRSANRSPSGSSVPASTVYQRVGCRLCQQGQSRSSRHCNGRLGRRILNRDASLCEIHNVTV